MGKKGLLLASSLALAACGDAHTSAPPLVVDSAGISVVRHVDEPTERLALSSDPDVVLGARPDGSDALYRVRGGILRPGGGVVVANQGSSELLYLASDGSLIRRVGGEGQGPSEFANIFWLQPEDEGTLAVSDAGNFRIVRFDGEGRLLSTQSVSVEPEGESGGEADVMRGPGFPIGTAREGRVIVVPWASAVLDGADGPLPLRGELRNYSADLSEYEPLDSVRLRTWYETDRVEGPPVGQILESPVFLFSGSGAWIAYSEAITHRITVLRDGVVSHVVEEDRARQPFAPDSVPEHVAAVADSLPAYRELAVDSDGRVWVKAPTENEAPQSRWRIFSDGGMTVRALELPASSSVLDAVGDRLLLLERDSLDVETVAIRRIADDPPN
jgi:hypothetical protein